MMKLRSGSMRPQLLTTVALFSSFAGTISATAQDTKRYELEEIMVTAQKREATLQETPISVSVTGSDTIEKANILDISDLQSVVPSLRVSTLQNSVQTNFIIRGFGNGANNAGIEPSVGVFIDGVYRSRSAAQIADLPRLERVEVLRGPQSTLFGKNASAGVISVVTAAPSYDPEASVEVGYGNYDQKILKGYITGGVTDTMAVSLSAGMNKRDGYTESLTGFKDQNDRNRWNARGQILLEPSENVRFRVIADYSEIDEICCTTTNILNGPAAGAIQFLGGIVVDDADPFSYTTAYNKDPENSVKDGGVSLQADVDFEKFSLTSISSYRHNRGGYDSDVDYGGLDILHGVSSDTGIDTYTQEIRLASTGVNKVDWMIGGYLFHENIEVETGLDYGADIRNYFDVLLSASSPGILSTLEALTGNAPGSFFSPDTTTQENFTQKDTAYSLFGTVDWHATDKLTATVGLSYTNDKKTMSGSTVNGDVLSSIDLFTANGGAVPAAFFGQGFFGATGLAPTPANIAFIESVAPGTSAAIQAGVNSSIQGLQALQFQPQFLAFPNAVEDGKTSDDKLTWTARLAYEVNDNFNAYASVATGYKATSWNLSRDSRPFAADAAALVAANLTQPNQSYGTRYAGPESATVYEMGIKARFPQGAFNVAVFHQAIKGFQSNLFQGTGFVLANAGKQSTKGIEIDATYLPVESLALTVAATFLDPVYNDFANAPGENNSVVDLSGEKPSGISEVSLSFAATYTHDFGNGMLGFIRGDYYYESETQVVDNVPDVFRDVSTFNASTGLSFENGLSVQVWGRNLFNDEYYVSAFPGVIQTGTIQGYPNQPRTYGISLRKDF